MHSKKKYWGARIPTKWGESESESEVAQSCPTLCDPMDCSLPGFSLHGILQVRVLEWVAISFSRGSSRPRDRTQVSRIPGRHFNLWATRESGKRVIQTYSISKTHSISFIFPFHEIYKSKLVSGIPESCPKASISVPRSSPTAHLICVYLYSPMSCVQYCTILGVPVTL